MLPLGYPIPTHNHKPYFVTLAPPPRHRCAVDEVPDEGLDVPLRLERMANEVTYCRLRATLRTLGDVAERGGGGDRAATSCPGAPLLEVLFGRRAPRFAAQPPAWQPINKGACAADWRGEAPLGGARAAATRLSSAPAGWAEPPALPTDPNMNQATPRRPGRDAARCCDAGAGRH